MSSELLKNNNHFDDNEGSVLILETREVEILDGDKNILYHPKTADEVLYIIFRLIYHRLYASTISPSQIILINSNNLDIKKKDLGIFRKSNCYKESLKERRYTPKKKQLKNQKAESNRRPAYLKKYYSFVNGHKKKVEHLFNNLIILNQNDLEIMTRQNGVRKGKVLSYVPNDISKIHNIVGDKKVVAFSNYMSLTLAHVLLALKNVEFYKLNFSGKHGEDDEIAGTTPTWYRRYNNDPSYLNYFIKYEHSYKRKVGDIMDISRLSFISNCFKKKKGLNKTIMEPFYKDMMNSVNGISKKTILCGGNKYISYNLIKEIKLHHNVEFAEYNCYNGDYKIKDGKVGLVFTNVDKLSPAKQTELCSDLLTGPYKDNFIILQSNKTIRDNTFNKIKEITVPKYSELSRHLENFFIYMIHNNELIDEDIDEYENISEIVFPNSRLVNEVLNLIPSFSKMDYIVKELKNKRPLILDFGTVEFWYDFKEYIESALVDHLIKPKTIAKVIPAEQNSSLNKEYVYTLRRNKKYRIFFNGKSIDLKNEGSDGLLYIYHIIKYAKKESIHVSDLYRLKLPSVSDDNAYKNLKDLENSDMFNRDKHEDYDLIDKKTIKEVRKTISDLEEEIDFLKENDQPGIIDLEEELEKNKNYLKKAIELNGSSKKIPEGEILNNINNKKAIDKAIKAVMHEVKSLDIGFFTFLKQSIRYNYRKYSYSYTPPDHIHWTLE
ncbi:MAG: hypothetical protein P4L35_13595 [Ignavibacteriaceae bacterium]|nr:hypothetical protein [Ignavibacteriaceae bacterium]